MNKAFILSEIKRTAKENGGKPLGRDAFRKETKINDYDWSLYWNRFSDAQREAGFKPNKFDNSHDPEELTQKFIELIKKLGRFPLQYEIQRESRLNTSFPSSSVFFNHFGGKPKIVAKVIEYCQNHEGFEDVATICSAVPIAEKPQETEDAQKLGQVGYVYLRKSHRRYKIGATYDLKRRDVELARQSAYPWEQIAVIETDDPFGVEAYWKNRFKDKPGEKNEFFKLSGEDVKAFKRWRNIY